MPITIEAPKTGISRSPFTGFADIRNIDISEQGAAKLNNPLVKKSSTTVTDLIQWFVKSTATPTTIYGLDLSGVVYVSTDSGGTWAVVSGEATAGEGQGLAIWKDYLIVARASYIDVYGPLSGTPAWTDNWQAIDADSKWHPMIVSKNDGMLYGGAGNYIFSIEEVSGSTFDPATGSTFTFTKQALDLPAGYRIKCLEELRNNLMIGTWKGTDIYDFRVADIFPWNRSDSSFNKPISIAEHGINAMLTIGNYIIVLAGIGGGIYKTDGYNAVKIGQVPDNIADLTGGKYIEPYPGAIINYKGKPFFGLSGSGLIDGMGIWSLEESSRGNILNLEHGISTGNYGASAILKIGALAGITRDELITGWRDDTAYGIDKTNNTAYASSYSGYFISPLYSIGSLLEEETFTQLIFQLAQDLAADEGVKISYRTNLGDAFTDIGTYDFSGLGAVLSHNTIPAIPSSEMIQIKISLTGVATTPLLRSVKLL